MVAAATHYNDPATVARVSTGLGKAMVGLLEHEEGPEVAARLALKGRIGVDPAAWPGVSGRAATLGRAPGREMRLAGAVGRVRNGHGGCDVTASRAVEMAVGVCAGAELARLGDGWSDVEWGAGRGQED
eukprot:3854031-Prymnesium_polylepis.1